MKKKLIGILVALTLCVSGLTGCTNKIGTQTIDSKITVSSGESESVPEVDTYIELSENINVDGDGVVVNDNKVTINRGGTYSISGTLKDGQIVVEASEVEKVYIILNGVDITCSNSSAIYVKEAEKTIISLADNTENYIRDSENYELEDENDKRDAAIYSKDNLTFIGNGSLTVEGNYNDGITGKDDLKIESGNITVNAVNSGIKGKDSLIITGGNITVNSGQDGIKSNNDENTEKGYVLIEGGKINITSGNDGIQGENNVYVRNGDIKINSGGGSENGASHNEMGPGIMGRLGDEAGNAPTGEQVLNDENTINLESSQNEVSENSENTTSESKEETSDSYKGIKAGTKIIIEGGTFNIDSGDDSIHANDTIIIHQGTFNILSGDDGIHADKLVEINSGTINVNKSYEGIEGETININDGKIYVKASDDGINVAGGTDTEAEEMNSAEGGGHMGKNPPSEGNMQGERPQFDEANASNMQGENQPFNDNNQMPQINGDKPNTDSNQEWNNSDVNNMQNIGQPPMKNQGQAGPMGNESSGTGVLNINGGYVVVDADGDGLDANGSIYMNAGTMIVYGPTNDGNGALDFDGEFKITSGLLVAAGSTGMAMAPSNSSTQNSIKLTLSEQEAGTLVRIESEDEKDIVTITPTKKFTSVIVSSPDLKTGSTYKVYTGGSVSGGTFTDGLYTGVTYNKGEEILSVGLSEIITSAMEDGVTVSRDFGRVQGRRRNEDSTTNQTTEGNAINSTNYVNNKENTNMVKQKETGAEVAN